MAFNYEKAVAMFAIQGTDEKFLLPPKDRLSLIADVVDNSLLRTLSTRQEVSDVSAGTVNFLKLQRTNKKKKTTIGLKITDIDPMKFTVETVKWDDAYFNSAGFTRADLNRGLPEASAQKMQLFMDDYIKDVETEKWGIIEDHIMTNKDTMIANFDYNNFLSSLGKGGSEVCKMLYLKIISLATKLTKHENKKDGIRFINKNSIVIHVKPELFDALAIAGIAGNRAEQTFNGGQYSIATLGGYRIMSNQFLDKLDVVVSTDYSCGTGFRLNAANIDRIGLTNDVGIYYEAQSLFGIIYPSLFLGLGKKPIPASNPNTASSTTPSA